MINHDVQPVTWSLEAKGRPDPFRLDEREMSIWSTSLEPGEAWLDRFRRILSPDELDRAARFRFDEHRRRFITARGILRTLIASCTNMAPEQVRFGYGAHGKPFVAGDIRFNMSDSGPFAVYAIGTGREVGIDVEQIRGVRDADGLARRFFAPREAEAIIRAQRDKENAFFTCWTRKEAYIKARGEGLSMPLHTFEVSIDPGEPPRLVSAALDPAEATRWSMDAFNPAPGYIAAVVSEGHGLRLRHYAVQYATIS